MKSFSFRNASTAKKTALCYGVAIFLLSIYPAKLALIEGWGSAIWDIIYCGGDTVYSSEYSDCKFLQVSKGMSEAEVKDLLGEPLDTYPNKYGHAGWDIGMRWTKSAYDSHYRMRVLLFQHDVVTEKHAEFYLD
ncbi:MAG: hypothetical protein SD837_04180 [Candidatus Electrothrix scaldis]|nr:MAG: hypothetical protein SD837_04180 [Candidatus Electrothrix sp. GW3-3]